MKYERPIKTLQDESNVLSHDLEVMDYQAKKINEKYDDQVKALEEVQRVNDAIIRQQQQQLGLADALTQGDIAAAAQAAQEMRASNAADFATSQTDALSQARELIILFLQSPFEVKWVLPQLHRLPGGCFLSVNNPLFAQ